MSHDALSIAGHAERLAYCWGYVLLGSAAIEASSRLQSTGLHSVLLRMEGQGGNAVGGLSGVMLISMLRHRCECLASHLPGAMCCCQLQGGGALSLPLLGRAPTSLFLTVVVTRS
jgi:hypothetical protein